MSSALGFERVVIAYRAHQADSLVVATTLAQQLQEAGCSVLLGVTGLEHNPYPGFIQTWGSYINLAIVLGGDGSTLAAARHLAPLGIPMLAVNVGGHLGFLTQTSEVLTPDWLTRFRTGDYQTEERDMLQATVEGEPAFLTHCLNEFIIRPENNNRLPMTTVNLEVDGEPIDCYRGDGLIISTPTGSTSYTLAANGPILGTALPGIAITPICPASLTSRPIVLHNQRQLRAYASQPPDLIVKLWTDGVPVYSLRLGQKVDIRLAKLPARFLILEKSPSYFRTLREKLRWGNLSCDL